MILPLATFAEVIAVGATTLVAVGIGLFYHMKFGESARVWLLAAGALLGVVGQTLNCIPIVPPQAGDLALLAGAITLAIGIFWLWFVMLGQHR